MVLENDYSGLVLASSSRFYSHVGSVSYPAKKRTTVHFHSPQFHSRTSFTFVHEEPGILRLERAADASENKYVEFSLLYSLAVAGWLSEVEEWPSVLEVKVEADNDFYSQRQNLKDAGKDITLKSLKELPKCYAPSEYVFLAFNLAKANSLNLERRKYTRLDWEARLQWLPHLSQRFWLISILWMSDHHLEGSWFTALLSSYIV